MPVTHVLLSEFDIDEGSILRHEYPSPTGVDTHLLAELMVPDGAHAREEDWTIFYLNDLYCLNLVRTKKDTSVRRGAIVKAMAIVTSDPFIQVYKPVLLLALEEYYARPSINTLSDLFQSLSQLDLSVLPVLTRSQRAILRCSDRRDLFLDHFSSSTTSQTSQENTSFGSSDTSPSASAIRDTHFYDLLLSYANIKLPLRIPVGLEQDDIGDYSIIQLIQTFSAHVQPFPPPFHPHLHTAGAQTHPIILLLNGLLTNKRIVFLGSSIPAGQVASLVLAACSMASGGGSSIIKGFSARAFPYSNLTNRDNHESVPGYIAGVTNPRFEAFTSSWDLFCNIDTGKISVSKDLKLPMSLAAASTASLNSSASALHHTSNVTTGGMSRTQSDDSIALAQGSGSPLYTNNASEETVSFATAKFDYKESYDYFFMEDILSAIASHASEMLIRAKFMEYAIRIVRMASRAEEERTGATLVGWPSKPHSAAQNTLGSGFVASSESIKEMTIRAPILDAWRSTSMYQLAKEDWQEHLLHSQFATFDLMHQLTRLRHSRNLPPAEVAMMIKTLNASVSSDAAIDELLSCLPVHAGGLLPLTFCLFHPLESVREGTVELLQRIEQYPVGNKLIAALNHFHMLAYNRLKGNYEAASTTQ